MWWMCGGCVVDVWWLECPCARDVVDVVDYLTLSGWGKFHHLIRWYDHRLIFGSYIKIAIKSAENADDSRGFQTSPKSQYKHPPNTKKPAQGGF
jgi:hypothetical protein